MGYDQWIQVDISKEGCDSKTIKIALCLAFPGIVEYLEECETYENDKGGFHFDKDGGNLWDRHRIVLGTLFSQ